MTRQEALTLVGRKVRVYNHLEFATGISFVLTRYDPTRRQFTTRNCHTFRESPFTLDELVEGMSSNMLRIDGR
jgi:hypothetical protein